MKNMMIIKRNGNTAAFDTSKIEAGIRRANGDVSSCDTLSEGRIRLIAEEVCAFFGNRDTVPADEVLSCVETKLIELGSAELAKSYITYRYEKIIEDQNAKTMISRIRTFFTRLASWLCPA